VKDWDKLRKTGLGLTDDASTRVTLWPNGQGNREIWFKTADGKQGFSLSVSEGPHGLGARLYFFGGPSDIRPDVVVSQYGRNVEICQYKPDEKAQAFKRWYAHEETEADIALLGESYRRTKTKASLAEILVGQAKASPDSDNPAADALAEDREAQALLDKHDR
jgi:hypothetical protein